MSILKVLTDIWVIRQSVKLKKHFCKYFLQCFSSNKVLKEHEEVRLKSNSEQTVKSRWVSIKFKIYFKQLALLFKIYAVFECNVKRVRSSDRGDNTSYTKKD